MYGDFSDAECVPASVQQQQYISPSADTGSKTGTGTGTDTGSKTGTDTGSKTGTDTGTGTGTGSGQTPPGKKPPGQTPPGSAPTPKTGLSTGYIVLIVLLLLFGICVYFMTKKKEKNLLGYQFGKSP